MGTISKVGNCFPFVITPFSAVIKYFIDSILDLSLVTRSLTSLRIISYGYGLGVGIAFLLAALGIIFDDFWAF